MSIDLFRQLSETEVPPVPDELERSVHAEVNRWLLLMHLSEFLLRGLPLAAWSFSKAVLNLVVLTLSGKSLSDSKRR